MGKFTRKGLYRLECDCGAYLYTTVQNAENNGLPICGCGKTFVPASRELAMLLSVMCPAITEFETAKALGMDDRQAASWVEQRRREKARGRAIAALEAGRG